jgi:putative PIG3 family NAD(P)H quinone oxidoreductase
MEPVGKLMTAVVVEGGKGPASALRAETVETPAPGPGEILIRVRAAGINRPDLLQRMGLYPPPPGASPLLGLEVAGEVAALGEGAQRHKVGDRVVALLGGGGYAQFCRVDARHALPIPGGLSLLEAAALPETIFTVFANVFEGGALKAGETLLVHGATSGIGVAAIQMAKAKGARVIATSRGPEKARRALALGADVSVDAAAEDFAPRVRAEGGADVILDMVGAAYARQNLEALNPLGRLSIIAVQGGAEASIDLSKILRQRLIVTGSTLRPRSADEKARLARAVEAEIWPLIAAGQVRPVIEAVFPLAEAAAAHARLEEGGHVGKVMLEV